VDSCCLVNLFAVTYFYGNFIVNREKHRVPFSIELQNLKEEYTVTFWSFISTASIKKTLHHDPFTIVPEEIPKQN
jgi:hypothetical protein